MRSGKTQGTGLPVIILRLLLLLSCAAMSTTLLADPAVSQPAANSTLSGTTQTFTWSANGDDIDQWWLYVGTSAGAADIANSGDLGTSTQFDVIGIPVDSSTVYVRLWYFSSGSWGFTDSLYTSSFQENIDAPELLSPVADSVLIGGSVDLEWRDNNTPVNYWWLYVGSSPGSNDLFDSGTAVRNLTTVTIDQLPVDGSIVYVRLWYRTTGIGWRFVDSAYITGAGTGGGGTDDDAAIAANLALIANNSTRNTQFDDNSYRDVPANYISVSDLTINDDIYNEALLHTSNSCYFRVKCEVSHFAYDDPIVYPNEPGRAHLHMFFGNTQANAYSTHDSLLNTGTGTCNGEDLNRTPTGFRQCSTIRETPSSLTRSWSTTRMTTSA